MRRDILDRLWAVAEPTVFISKEAFVNNLDGWDITPITIDEELAFVFLVKGNALHFHTMGTGHKMTMKIIRLIFQPIIDKYGFVTTRTPKEETRQHRFNAVMGWKAVGEDEYDIHYRIDSLMRDRNRNAPCLS